MQYRKVGFTTSRGNIWTVSDEKLETDVDPMAVANELGKDMLKQLFTDAADDADNQEEFEDQLKTGLEFFDLVSYRGSLTLGIHEDPEGFVLVPSDSPLFGLPGLSETATGSFKDVFHWTDVKDTVFEVFWANGFSVQIVLYKYARDLNSVWFGDEPNVEKLEPRVWYEWSTSGTEGSWVMVPDSNE